MYTQDLTHINFEKDKLKAILEKSGATEWAYILHDKDVNEENKLIRPHIHVVLKFNDAKTISKIAKIFIDQPQYVEAWKGSISNAYSYLLHETSQAQEDKKYHYKATEVVASFDFIKRIEKIRKKANRPSKVQINDLIEEYADDSLPRSELEKKIGVLEMAKRAMLIKNIDEFLAEKHHKEFLKEFSGKKCQTFWIYGFTGVGKTKLSREILETLYPNNFVVLGSQRDHFQNYKGENYIILNDLRPSDYPYSELLVLLDPWEHAKMAPSRYHDKYLNAKAFFITTPYSVEEFYDKCVTRDSEVDTLSQLARRVKELYLDESNYAEIKDKVLTDLKKLRNYSKTE